MNGELRPYLQNCGSAFALAIERGMVRLWISQTGTDPTSVNPSSKPDGEAPVTTNVEARDDARARRAAKRVGLVAQKSRWRKYSIDNYGEFMLRDPDTSFPVYGFKWDLAADEVIEYCREIAED